MVFQPKVKPDAFTQSWHDCVLVYFASKEDVDVAKRVPFNGDGFYCSLNIATFVIPILLFVDDDGVVFFV